MDHQCNETGEDFGVLGKRLSPFLPCNTNFRV